jgi:hypothetical protein
LVYKHLCFYNLASLLISFLCLFLKIGKKALKMTKNHKIAFLSKIGLFCSLISGENPNQNKTCYSVLEMVECGQRYSGQFIMIYSACQKLFTKNQTEGPDIKIGHFRSIISNSWNCSIKKLFT